MIACHDCDLLQEIPMLEHGQRARCPRCSAVLVRFGKNGTERALAWTVAGLICFVIANSYPMLGLEAAGQVQQSTLLSGTLALWRDGMPILAGLVFLASIGLPLVLLVGEGVVLLSARLRLTSRSVRVALRLLSELRPWAMVDVFLLGLLVALVKLKDLAELLPGLALFAFVGLLVASSAARTALDAHALWEELEGDA